VKTAIALYYDTSGWFQFTEQLASFDHFSFLLFSFPFGCSNI